MVLQQSLGIADVLFGSHEHKRNHTLITYRGEMKNLVSLLNKAKKNSHFKRSVEKISLKHT